MKRNVSSTVLSATTACLFLAVSPLPVAYQDVADFAGKSSLENRWLSSIVAKPGRFVHDPDHLAGAQTMILNSKGEKLSGLNFDKSDKFTGYVFAPTPKIAEKVSRKTVVSRAGKGDLPKRIARRNATTISTGQMFSLSPVFSKPSENNWPAFALNTPAPRVVVAEKADRPRPNVVAAKKEAAPLALIPNAALAKIEEKAKKQADTEIDRTTTASIIKPSEVQLGYAVNKVEDPRAIFEAVLARRNGTAKLPSAPKEGVKTPVETAAVDTEKPAAAPKPKTTLKDLVKRPLRVLKGQHFWAAYDLPKSVTKKRQQRCLAAAIYFESRGEPEEGQAAVAQVVLNRVKAPAYPASICGVVYQNKHWRNRCQFSFACDGVYDRVRDKKSWARAVRIAREVTKGETYLPKVADSTHYHADYVNPRWRYSMRKLTKIGVHIFYRTKNGGWS